MVDTNNLRLGFIGAGDDRRLDSSRLADICSRFDVKELAIFGSAARGEMHASSDIDLMVEFRPGARVGIIRFETLAEELEAYLGHRVDLVTKRSLNPWIRPHALQDARIIYADDPSLLNILSAWRHFQLAAVL